MEIQDEGAAPPRASGVVVGVGGGEGEWGGGGVGGGGEGTPSVGGGGGWFRGRGRVRGDGVGGRYACQNGPQASAHLRPMSNSLKPSTGLTRH